MRQIISGRKWKVLHSKSTMAIILPKATNYCILAISTSSWHLFWSQSPVKTILEHAEHVKETKKATFHVNKKSLHLLIDPTRIVVFLNFLRMFLPPPPFSSRWKNPFIRKKLDCSLDHIYDTLNRNHFNEYIRIWLPASIIL